MAEKKRVHLVISGKVQGVCFRLHTQEQARQRGLTGWVRNLSTGQVETVFQGEETQVQDMIRWCHQGPLPAQVRKVECEEQSCTGEFQNFEIIDSFSLTEQGLSR